MALEPFSEEQARALINLAQRYEVWIEAERSLHDLPYDLRRKDVGGRFYLYEISDRSGNGKSLGPWTEEHEAKLTRYRADKANFKQRRDQSRDRLDESGRLGRALRLPMLANAAGPILREADRRLSQKLVRNPSIFVPALRNLMSPGCVHVTSDTARGHRLT